MCYMRFRHLGGNLCLGVVDFACSWFLPQTSIRPILPNEKKGSTASFPLNTISRVAKVWRDRRKMYRRTDPRRRCRFWYRELRPGGRRRIPKGARPSS